MYLAGCIEEGYINAVPLPKGKIEPKLGIRDASARRKFGLQLLVSVTDLSIYDDSDASMYKYK